VLHWSAKILLIPVKILGESYSFVIVESENDKQIAPSPTKGKGKRNQFFKKILGL